MPWWLCAILGAVFAGIVSVLVKPGIGTGDQKITSNLATAIRMLAVFPLAWFVVFAEGSFSQISKITSKQWTFLILSGLGTGLSWLFYFLAISKGEVNRVNPIDKSSLAVSFILTLIFLREGFKWQTTVATLLVLAALAVTLIPDKNATAQLPQLTTQPATVTK